MKKINATNSFLLIGLLVCLFSTLVQAQIPVVNLGADFSACGSSILDAGNSGATYLWSTAETTRQITVAASGVYSVTVTNGNGSGSDDVTVIVLPAPTVVVNDTIVCSGNIFLTATGIADRYLWYTNINKDTLLGEGNPLEVISTTNKDYYVEGYRLGSLAHIGRNSSSPVYDDNEPRGLVFDAFSDFFIDSVDVYLSGNAVFQVSLEDISGNIVYNVQTFNLTGTAGTKVTIPLGFLVTQGNNKVLYCRNITSSGLYMSYPLSNAFPYNLAGICSIKSSIQYGNPNFMDRYAYLFNWAVRKVNCVSPLDVCHAQVLLSPSVTLGLDTSLCASSYSIIPIVTPSSVTYEWTTGETTSSIYINSSNAYAVTVSNGVCASSDDINITIYNELIVNANDTVLCSGNNFLTATGIADRYLWYTNINKDTLLGEGNPLEVISTTNKDYYVEGYRLGSLAHIGRNSSSPVYDDNEPRGLVFDAFSDFFIDSVDVYLSGNAVFQVSLEDISGNIVYNVQTFNLTGTAGTKVTIPLGFLVTQGNNKVLYCRNITSSGLYMSYPLSNAFPYNLAGICSIKSSIQYGNPNFMDRYAYLFNWAVRKVNCKSSDSINVVCLNIPNRTLADISLCGNVGNFITAQNPGSTYLWSTGETTQEITATTSGDYIVTITNGGLCSIIDTASVQLLNLPATLAGGSATLCQSGNVSLLTPIAGEIYQWYNNPADTIPIYVGAPFQTYISQTDTFYVEAASRSKARTGLSNHPNSGGGYSNFSIATLFEIQRPIVLVSVAVYVNNPCSFSLVLKQNGVIKAQRNVTVPIANTKFFLPADFNLPIGTGYTLSFSGLSGGQLATGGTCANLSDGKITILNNSLGNGNCYYFYDWSYSYGYDGCKSPKVQYIVNVTHPFNLQSVVIACTPTVLNATSPNAAGYHWSNGASIPTITAMTAGTYIVTVTGISGTCNTIDSTTISLPLPVGLPSNGLLCGNTLQTNYTSSNATFLWENGATTATRTIITAGTYSVTVTTNGCVLQDQIIVTSIAPLPTISLPTVQTFCNSGVLNAGNASSYTWSDNSHNSTLNVNTPGIYSVTVSNAAGCTATASANVSIEQPATANFIYAISPNNPYRYTFTNQSTGSTNYLWDFGFSTSTSVNPVVVFPSNGTYTVHLIVTNSCGSDTLTQIVNVAVGNESLSKNNYQINIFPNPTEDILNIETDIENTPDEIFNISIIDMQGRGLIGQLRNASEMTKFSINITNLASGVYLLQVSNTRGGIIHKRFVRL